MSSENLQSCVSGADTSQVTVASTSTLVAHATIDTDPTSTYPRRKNIKMCNTGTKAIFVKIGSAPVATSDYHFVLVPSQGTIDTSNYIAPGTYLEDINVEQDNIYAITSSSTSTLNVYIGV